MRILESMMTEYERILERMTTRYERILRNGIDEIHVEFVDGERRDFTDGPYMIETDEGTIRIFRLWPKSYTHVLSFGLGAVKTMTCNKKEA